MLYNDSIFYNQNNVEYNGLVIINVPGILNPIILGDLVILIGAQPDYSNATTIGIITYDFAPSGQIVLETTQEQAQAIIGAEILIIDSVSGESYIQGLSQSQASSQISIISPSSVSGELAIESI